MGRKLKTLEDLRAKRRYKDAIIIDNWDHLMKWYEEHGPSETHKIVFHEDSDAACLELVDPETYNYKIGGPWEKYIKTIDHYLSTHTFYGKGSWIHSTEVLNKCGFKGIIIRNWDAKSEGQEWPEITYPFYADDEDDPTKTYQ